MERLTATLTVAALATVGVIVLALVSDRLGEDGERRTSDPGSAAAPAAAPDPATDDPSPQGAPSTPDAPSTPGAPSTPDASATSGPLTVSTAGWDTRFDMTSIDLSEIISGGPGKDGIPAIDEPKFEQLSDARRWLVGDRVPVIALEINGDARAYPLAILLWHEIVNDNVGGVPVVVTFCPLCNTALVFERALEGVTYDFGTTGNLRFSDLVMYDRQTESWWQQATGEAIVGSLTGSKLTFVPAQIVSLADFAATYPDGLSLSRETGNARDYGRNPYVGYDSIDQQPFLFRGVVDGRLSAMERVVTVGAGGEAVAYAYSELAEVGVVEDDVGGMPIVVFWQPGVSSALDAAWIDEGRDVGATGVFSPVLDGRPIDFERAPDASIVDVGTGSTWSVTGQATAGPLAGSRLQPVAHGDHFWFAWAAFEPDTRIWTSAE